MGLGLTTIGVPSMTLAAQGARPAGPAAAHRARIVAQASSSPAAMTASAAPSTSPSMSMPASSAPSMPAPTTGVPPEEFGSPPTGEIPILFNDRHVYAKPDKLKEGRVLAALIRGNVILVPMRSMFEQMGATVAFDARTKTVDVNKPGSDVKVTVGKPEVIINGESRPLDVPPEIYKGTVVVPLRVLSEGMGAYVLWVPEKRLVVVRYLAAPVPTPSPTEMPTEAPTPAATAAPTLTPTPVKRRSPYEHFLVGDYVNHPSVYNELNQGSNGKASFRVDGAIEFPFLGIPWMLEGDFRSYRYQHQNLGNSSCPSGNSSCVTAIGNQGVVVVPTFQARDDDFDGRIGIKVADPRIYIGVGYIFRNTNYEGGAFPTSEHGLGGGIEKLPDTDQPFSLYGSAFYYPEVTTNAFQQLGGNVRGQVEYRVLKYNVGITFSITRTPFFFDLGFLGDTGDIKQNAPVSFTHSGPYAGLGVHF